MQKLVVRQSPRLVNSVDRSDSKLTSFRDRRSAYSSYRPSVVVTALQIMLLFIDLS
jgi:hypothetical protein